MALGCARLGGFVLSPERLVMSDHAIDASQDAPRLLVSEDESTAPSDPYFDRFAGVGRVVGARHLDALRHAHVAVIGIGGVGSWTAEALARSGVGRLTLIDLDDVCVTNTNRQIVALTSTIGQEKAEVMAARIRDIAPMCHVHAVCDFYTPSNADALLDRGFDVVVDAIDAYRDKLDVIRRTKARNIPLVVVGGAGGRIDPTRIQRADLNRTSGDALLKRLRRDLRGERGFPRDKTWGIVAVYTDEPRTFPGEDGEPCATAGRHAKMDCREGMGALTWITGTMGFFAAAEAVRLLGKTSKKSGV